MTILTFANGYNNFSFSAFPATIDVVPDPARTASSFRLSAVDRIGGVGLLFDDQGHLIGGNITSWQHMDADGQTVLFTLGGFSISATLFNTFLAANQWSNFVDVVLHGNDTITGGGSDDFLQGGAGNDILYGGDGKDTLDGGTGNDTMRGGAGNDKYIVDSAKDKVIEAQDSGIDTIQSSINLTLTTNVENLILTGIGNLKGIGNVLANDITGNAGNNFLDGGLGADHMSGAAGNDTYIVDNEGDTITENASEGTDQVFSSVSFVLSANIENMQLRGKANIDGTGNASDNILVGNSGSNTLTGNDGNDTLDGGLGADKLVGGAGNDTYVIDNVGDIVVEGTGDSQDLIAATISIDLNNASYANVENVLLIGRASIAATGNAGNNILVGNTGKNTLGGNDGNDILDGGAGKDILIGGKGDDVYIVDNIGDRVIENASEGTDEIRTVLSYNLSALGNIENLRLTGTANIDGVGNDLSNTITGNSGQNILNGGAGDDTLDGGAGADFLIGGLGNDTFIVDNALDQVIEFVNGGSDLVKASVSYVLSSNVENLTLTGFSNISGTGNALDNVITGNSGANTLIGGAGNDTLDGGKGVDHMTGGDGNDIYFVRDAGDIVDETGSGVDEVKAFVSYTLTANVENLTLQTGAGNIDGTGNVLDNTITGNEGNNRLDGSVGADKMIGGNGNDTYVVDNQNDTVDETATNGTDLVIASIDFDLSSGKVLGNVENLTLTGATGVEALSGTGNGLDNVIIGNGGANILDGGAGNDTLDGGAGADKMTGGIGNDTFIVDNIGDMVFENANEGDSDLVKSSITFSLAALDNVEHLTLTGAANIDGTGNAQSNIIFGNDGNNILDGNGGGDTLVGGNGNDTYIVHDVADIVEERGTTGNDLVKSFVSYSIDQLASANVENLTLIGNLNIDGTGNDLDNVIIGNVGDNVLDGGKGVDTLIGGDGNDTYIVDNVRDLIDESGSTGIDLVKSSVSYTLGENIENLTLSGNQNLNATGNELDNTITGNSGDNILNGGFGEDTLIGGAGNDTYYIDSINDVINDTAGSDDMIVATITIDLSSYTGVEHARLVGKANIDIIGDGHDNHLTGNAGANYLEGGAGLDILVGGAGDDFLYGGTGTDTLTGGLGADIFHYEALAEGSNLETITDFTVGVGGDMLDLGDLLDTLNNYDGTNAFSGGYLEFDVASDPGNTIVKIDSDGGADSFQVLVTLTGISLDKDLHVGNYSV